MCVCVGFGGISPVSLAKNGEITGRYDEGGREMKTNGSARGRVCVGICVWVRWAVGKTIQDNNSI